MYVCPSCRAGWSEERAEESEEFSAYSCPACPDRAAVEREEAALDRLITELEEESR